MKRYIFTSVLMFMMFATASFSQNKIDTLLNRSRMAELSIQRSQLKQRITAEDKKRNSQLTGVAPEQMELINLRQDSLCLELRSQLTTVELEIAELKAIMQMTSNTTTPEPQSTTSVQQVIQSLKPNQPGKKKGEKR